MMRYNTIKYNDIANSPGVAVSIYLQGCPSPHCKNCFNPETWDFDQGELLTLEVIEKMLSHLRDNNINRTLCILGGEPLCEENLPATKLIIENALKKYPDLKIYIWSRFLMEDLWLDSEKNHYLDYILHHIYCLIDGPFIEEKKKLNMPMRGSTNQRIFYLKDL